MPDEAAQDPDTAALVEELAAIEHERWAHWQAYLHSRCEAAEDGSLIIPAELVARWTEQVETEYRDLTEREKDSDREQVRRYLPRLLAAMQSTLE